VTYRQPVAHAQSYFSELVRTQTDYYSVSELGEEIGLDLPRLLRNARKGGRLPSRKVIDAIIDALPEVPYRYVQEALLMDANPVGAGDYASRDARAEEDRTRAHVQRVIRSVPEGKREALLRIIEDIAAISR
jgi:hypothetical protein